MNIAERRFSMHPVIVRASIFLENSTLEKTKDFLKILGQGNQGIQGTLNPLSTLKSDCIIVLSYHSFTKYIVIHSDITDR